MRILMLDRAGAQSIWSVMSAIADLAEAEGHEVHRCRWDEGGVLEDRLPPGPRDHVISVPHRRRPLDVIGQHRAFCAPFTALLDAVRPDVLQANFIVPGGFAMYLARIWRRRRGISCRIVLTRHELYGSMSPHLRLWAQLSAGCADHLIHVSDQVAQSYGLKTSSRWLGQGEPPRALVIHNGLDRAWIDAITPYPRPDSARVFVLAGRLVPVKGQRLALRALAASPDIAVRLEIIGDGPERPALMAMAKDLGLERRVDFIGWRPRIETLARMRSARAVLVPSTQEGFGLSLAEAMALGSPVLASDIAVFREVAAEGRGVRLLPPCDVALWAQAMAEVQGRAVLPAGALDQNVMAQRYLALYRSGGET